MSADTIIAAIGSAAALFAALFAYLALGKASETVREAKAARLDAEQAARDAAADRREAERDRRYRRVERVGELVEDLYRKSYSVGTDIWATDRNRLGHALVGLTDQLPRCAALMHAETPVEAAQMITDGREEVRQELERLSKEEP